MRDLYDQHGSALFGYALRLTGDRGQAEEIVQETMIRAWREAERAGAVASSRPWLFTVARNLATDRWRAAAARPRTVGDETLLAAVAAPDELDRAVESWGIADAARSLSAAHRQVLLHLFHEGRTVGETAALLGVPPGTVKSRCYYALRALRAALEERGLLL